MADTGFTTGTSVVGAVCAVILAVVGFFREWRKYRSDDKKELKQKIDETQAALDVALENHMITDAHNLQIKLRELWDQYRKRDSGGAKTALVAASVVPMVLCSGCFTHRQDSQAIVIGERINVVKPGQELVVPELVPPAKAWYLVDNVGLSGWLGLSIKREEE